MSDEWLYAEGVRSRQDRYRAQLERRERADHPRDRTSQPQPRHGERRDTEGAHDADHIIGHLSQVAVPSRQIGRTKAS